MTRINVGIHPHELCDQHLIAEYHELPRCFRAVKRRAPEAFKLGTGHMAWCAQYQGSLKQRFRDLVAEIWHRGFDTPTYVECTTKLVDRCWSATSEDYARPLLMDRIRERLGTMKRVPTWTRRERPEWVVDLVLA